MTFGLRSCSIKSAHNEAVMSKLLKEVKGLNPSFDGADIHSHSINRYCPPHWVKRDTFRHVCCSSRCNSYIECWNSSYT